MAAKSLSLQDHFLNSLRRAKLPVTIFLVKGVKLQGVVTWFDAFSLLLRREGSSQLVYKHSISTIMPPEPPPDFTPTVPKADGGKAGLQDLFLAAAAREHGLAGTLDQDRGPEAPVPRLAGIAQAPFVPDLRDAGRRPAAEDADLHAALLNNLKKLAVVASAS